MSHFVSYVDAVRDALLGLDDVRRGACWWASNRDAHCHLGECFGITRIRNDYFGLAPILVSYSVHRRLQIPSSKDRKRRAAFMEFAESLPLFVPCQIIKLRGEVDIRINSSICISPRGSPRGVSQTIWEEVVRRSQADRLVLSRIDSTPF